MSPACKEITYRKNEKSGNLSLDDDKKNGQTSRILGAVYAVSGGVVFGADI